MINNAHPRRYNTAKSHAASRKKKERKKSKQTKQKSLQIPPVDIRRNGPPPRFHCNIVGWGATVRLRCFTHTVRKVYSIHVNGCGEDARDEALGIRASSSSSPSFSRITANIGAVECLARLHSQLPSGSIQKQQPSEKRSQLLNEWLTSFVALREEKVCVENILYCDFSYILPEEAPK